MTINTDATSAREQHRRYDGQFGAQKHTAPELRLDPVTAVDDAHSAFNAAAHEAKAANVAWAAAHMPEHIKGVRFIRQGDDVIPALFMPATRGGHIAGAGDYQRLYLWPVTAYAGMRSEVVALEELTEESGNTAWDWVPTAEQRAMSTDDADAARATSGARYAETREEFYRLAPAYLRQQMPAGVDRVIIAHGPEEVDGRYVSIPQIIEAYDSNGDFVQLDLHAEENAGYVRTVANFGFSGRGHFPHGTTETGATEYIISREA